MARIPEAELQHLKAAVPLIAVVKQQGRQMFKKGRDFTVLCPFHDKKTPSCVVSPEKTCTTASAAMRAARCWTG